MNQPCGAQRWSYPLFRKHPQLLWVGLGVAAAVGMAGCDRPSLAIFTAPSSLALQPEDNAQGITVFLKRPIQSLSPHPVGINLHATQDISRPGMLEILHRTQARIVRWPGGSESDHYQWRTHQLAYGWFPHPNSTFDLLMQRLVKPAQMEVAITLNYGSNAKQSGGSDPREAAAWVAYAKSKGYRIAYWTVGNEVFGSWETDLNKKTHDAGTYATKVAKAFYPQIKAADPQAKVGVVVNQYDLSNPLGWTQTVLRQAQYDFVEIHSYPQSPDTASDEYLLQGAIEQFKQQITALQQVMRTVRWPQNPNPVPILLGEFNNVPSRPNKQTLSIVNALYHGIIFAESAKLGLAAAFPWELVEDYCTYAPQTGLKSTGNFSEALYGWQTFATYSLFSLGLPNSSQNCRQGVPPIPFGTAFPAAHAAALFGEFAAPNAQMLDTDVSLNYPQIRAYAATHRQGYRLLLFNLNQTAPVKLPLSLRGEQSQWQAQQITYGKKEYDHSKYNRWTGPTRQNLGNVGANLQVTLPAWSMNILALEHR